MNHHASAGTLLAITLVVAVVGAGCGKQAEPAVESGQSSTAATAGAPSFQVHTSAGMMDGFPAQLDVYNGKVPGIGLSIGAGHAGKSWGARAKLARGSVLSGTMSVALVRGAVEQEGTGSLVLSSGGAGGAGVGEEANSGTLALSVVTGHVTGSVRGASSTLDATFEGAIGVSCWVPASALPAPSSAGATPDPGYAEPLSLDESFVTPECAPFKHLAR